ncbi:MAG: hypothetical protein Q8L23_15905 [Caulobacter sp.]|nr:hypothetical protein [Caulobacter sp.]
MTDRTTVDLAHDALVALFQGALPDITPTRDRAIPRLDEGQFGFLNVVLSGQPPQVQAECMGLVEDEVEVEFVQTFNVEWIVRNVDDDARDALFGQGLRAIETAIRANLTLGGQALGMTIGPPVYETAVTAQSPATRAALVPVRVALRGVTMLS